LICFSILVVAVDPSYFNFFQRFMWTTAFLVLLRVYVAGWLWSKPQAEHSAMQQATEQFV
jgi:hypothetical protein